MSLKNNSSTNPKVDNQLKTSTAQQTNAYLKLTTETLGKGVKYVKYARTTQGLP